MDPITHALAGSLLGRAGLNRLAPRMAPLAVLSSVWPDADAITLAVSETLYLEAHRGWTHALLMQPLQAALLTLPWRWWAGRAGPVSRGAWFRAWLAAWFCLTLHIFFDTWNVYGVRPFAPFSWEWVHFDWLHVFDLWVWAILLLGLLAPMLARLVDSEIGARKGSGRSAAWFALLCLAGYVSGRALLHDRAVAQVNSRLIHGEPPRVVMAVPGPANPLRWKGVVETASAWHVVDVPLTVEFDPDAVQSFYKPETVKWIDAARPTRTGRIFLDFSKATVWRVLPGSRFDGSIEVRATDLRFGLPSEGRFSADWLFDQNGRVLSEKFHFDQETHSR